MLDNRIKFNIFTTVETLHNNPKKEILIETHNYILKTDLKCRQKFRILCLHSSDCLDCGILSCNSTWSLQQILLLLAFKWKQAGNLTEEPAIQNLSLWHLQNICPYSIHMTTGTNLPILPMLLVQR